MKIVVTHSSGFDYEAELYAPLRASALAAEHTLVLPHEPGNRDVPTRRQLADADLVVAEVSYPSTGQGIELGYADVLGVPILLLHRAGTRPSGSLRFLSGAQPRAYGGPDGLVRAVADRVAFLDGGPGAPADREGGAAAWRKVTDVRVEYDDWHGHWFVFVHLRSRATMEIHARSAEEVARILRDVGAHF